MKRNSWSALLATLTGLVVCGCTDTRDPLVRTSDSFSPAPVDAQYILHPEEPWLGVFYEYGPTIEVTDSAFVDRNVTHIGNLDADIDMVLVIGDAAAPVTECTLIYIHNELVPDRNHTIADGIWRIMDQKTHPRFSERPMEQRYSTLGWREDAMGVVRPYAGLKAASVEHSIFMQGLGIETQGCRIGNGTGPTWHTLGEKTIAVEDEPITTIIRYLYPEEI